MNFFSGARISKSCERVEINGRMHCALRLVLVAASHVAGFVGIDGVAASDLGNAMQEIMSREESDLLFKRDVESF